MREEGREGQTEARRKGGKRGGRGRTSAQSNSTFLPATGFPEAGLSWGRREGLSLIRDWRSYIALDYTVYSVKNDTVP